MKVTIIAGSHRANSQSSKIAKVMSALLEQAPEHCETTVIDLADNPLPLWDASIWSGDEAWQERLTPISAQLASSDAFIIIAPEWHGMAPAGLKNFFLL